MTTQLRKLQRHRNTGFSLVEVMVGLLIGMIALLVMLQVLSLTEGQRRTTTGGGDAQSNGATALYGIQRDISLAGYGISSVNLLGCSLTLRAGVSLGFLAPVTINSAAIPAGDPNTDTLLIVYGSASGSTEGDVISSQPATTTYAVPTSNIAVGARVIATRQSRPTPCELVLDIVESSVLPNLGVQTGGNGFSNGTLFNLGLPPTATAANPDPKPRPQVIAYAIRNGNLTMCDYWLNDCSLAANKENSAIWIPLANNIVSMRAQYGRDSTVDMDGTVDIYDQDNTALNPDPAPGTSIDTACQWARVSAIRLVLVARSTQLEKETVTGSAPAWAASEADNPLGSTATPINLSKYPDGTDNTSWQKYRYKTFQTVVPIRNIAWQGVPSGC